MQGAIGRSSDAQSDYKRKHHAVLRTCKAGWLTWHSHGQAEHEVAAAAAAAAFQVKEISPWLLQRQDTAAWLLTICERGAQLQGGSEQTSRRKCGAQRIKKRNKRLQKHE